MNIRLSGLCLALTALCPGGSACLWDRDTLAVESKGRMDFVAVLVGRFERNPPLYYQMRIDRESKELRRNPARLDDYDDIAVAESRLGKNDLALDWMKRKRAELNALKSKDKEAWYRLFANEGTFYTLRWMKNGCNPNDLTDNSLAIDDLDKAIKINPDAHFGREWVQREFLMWAQDPANRFGENLYWNNPDRSPLQNALGLAGLIRLGEAWESPEITAALGAMLAKLNEPKGARIAGLAYYRTEELLNTGKASLGPDLISKTYSDFFLTPGKRLGYSPSMEMDSFDRAQYKRLRRDADAWERNRTAFMMERMKAGRHPDTDPHFWDGYVDSPALTVKAPMFWEIPGFWANFASTVEYFAVMGFVIGCGYFYLAVWRRPLKDSE